MTWKAQLQLNYRMNGGRISFKAHHTGPLLVQKPYLHNNEKNLHHYILHPPGGLVGGDTLHTEVNLQDDVSILLTSPSAQKVYRSQQKTALSSLTTKIANGAILSWLPQETILFDNSHFKSVSDIHMKSESSLILWEIFVFGRPSIQEVHNKASIDSTLRIFVEDQPILIDRYLKAPLEKGRSLFSGVQNFNCYGQLIIVSPDLKLLQDEHLPGRSEHISWTRYGNMLQFRFLGNSAYDARRHLEQTITQYHDSTGRYYTKPRIWAY